MYIYNVTFNVENSILEEWQKWITQHYIFESMESNYFKSIYLYEVLSKELQGRTFALHHLAETEENIKQFHIEQLPRLRKELHLKFQDKYVFFETLLKRT